LPWESVKAAVTSITIFSFAQTTKIVATRHVLLAQNIPECVWGWGLQHCPHPLAGFNGVAL